MKYSLLNHTKAQHDVPSHHVFFFTTATAQVLTFQAGESGVWIPLPRTQGFLCSSTRCRQPGLPKAQCPLIDLGCSAEVTADQETGPCGWWKEFCCLTAPLAAQLWPGELFPAWELYEQTFQGAKASCSSSKAKVCSTEIFTACSTDSPERSTGMDLMGHSV